MSEWSLALPLQSLVPVPCWRHHVVLCTPAQRGHRTWQQRQRLTGRLETEPLACMLHAEVQSEPFSRFGPWLRVIMKCNLKLVTCNRGVQVCKRAGREILRSSSNFSSSGYKHRDLRQIFNITSSTTSRLLSIILHFSRPFQKEEWRSALWDKKISSGKEGPFYTVRE